MSGTPTDAATNADPVPPVVLVVSPCHKTRRILRADIMSKHPACRVISARDVATAKKMLDKRKVSATAVDISLFRLTKDVWSLFCEKGFALLEGPVFGFMRSVVSPDHYLRPMIHHGYVIPIADLPERVLSPRQTTHEEPLPDFGSHHKVYPRHK